MQQYFKSLKIKIVMAKKSIAKKKVVLMESNFRPNKESKTMVLKLPPEIEELYLEYRKLYANQHQGSFVSKRTFVQRMIICGSQSVFDKIEY